MAAAMPAPLPQQRAAAALQLGMASGNSPKGVGSVAVQALVRTSRIDCQRTASVRARTTRLLRVPWKRHAWLDPVALRRRLLAYLLKPPDLAPSTSYGHPVRHTIYVDLQLRLLVANSPSTHHMTSAHTVGAASDRVVASCGMLVGVLGRIRMPLTAVVLVLTNLTTAPLVAALPLDLDVKTGRVLWRGGADAANLTLIDAAAACHMTRLAPSLSHRTLDAVLARDDQLRERWRLLQLIAVITTAKR